MTQQRQTRIVDLSQIKYDCERFFLGGLYNLYEEERFVAAVETSHCAVEMSYGKLVLSCWGEGWSRSWRVVSCTRSADRLELSCSRQIGRVMTTLVLQRGDPPAAIAISRAEFASRVSALIEANLPGVQVERVLTSRDDSRHLSGVQARFVLKERNHTLAGIAVSKRESRTNLEAVISAGLIWLENLRHKRAKVPRLLLCVPDDCVFNVSCRLLYLRRENVQFSLYALDELQKRLQPVPAFAQADLSDGLKRASQRADWSADGWLSPGAAQAIETIQSLAPGLLDRQPKNGWTYLSIRGLTIARVSRKQARVEFGIEKPRRQLTEKNQNDLSALITTVVRHRQPAAPKRREPFFRLQAERWLESMLRKDITALDVMLDERFVYSQVPAYRGDQRSFIDLLAVTRTGRLVVIELKVSEDLEFPLQGLDYWIRVDWHRRRGDFARRGYFQGLTLRDESPLIYLVAPLFRFHAMTKLIAGAIVKEVPVYRLGINEDWRSGITVLLKERLN